MDKLRKLFSGYVFNSYWEISQAAVDTLASRATEDKFQLNETKCKELLINFNTNNPTSFDPVVINGMPTDLVTTVEPRLTTTPFIRPPRYYGHILSNQT